MTFKNKRGPVTIVLKPRIKITDRGEIFFNKSYMELVKFHKFNVDTENDIITFKHSDKVGYTIINRRCAYFLRNKPLADFLKNNVGTEIFPKFMALPLFDTEQHFCIEINRQIQQPKGIIFDGTIYSITDAKNRINTMRKRAENSVSLKTSQANIKKHNDLLQIAKDLFPLEFVKYEEIE